MPKMKKMLAILEPWIILKKANILNVKKICFIIIASIVISILELSTLVLISSLNNIYSSYGKQQFFLITSVLILLCIFSFILRSFCIYKSNIYSAYIGNMIGKKSIESLLSSGYENLSQKNLSEVFVQLTTFINQISSFVISPILQSLNIIFTALLLSITAIKITGITGFLTVIFIGSSYLLFAFNLRKKIDFISRERVFLDEKIVNTIDDGMRVLRELFIENKEKDWINNFSEQDKKLKLNNSLNNSLSIIPKYFLEFLLLLILLILFAFNFEKFQSEGFLLTIGITAFKLVPCFQNLYSSWVSVKANYKAFLKVIKLIKIDRNEYSYEKSYGENNKKAFEFSSIKAESINYSYPQSKTNVLENISFNFQRAKVYGITGQSGSGKTTLLDIITGLRKPKTGSIKLITKDSQLDLSKKNIVDVFSYVGQNSLIYNLPLKENLRSYGNESKLPFTEFENQLIERFELKELIVRGKGIPLKVSGGQAQRILIARAILKMKPILILDEATSGLDLKMENLVFKVIRETSFIKMVIVVSHDINLLQKCDYIYELNRGNLNKSKRY